MGNIHIGTFSALAYTEALVMLLLVNLASTATAERSFISLRRLKTYLRSTYGRRRLNNLAICHVHKYVMDTIDVTKLMKKFTKDNRSQIFGHIETAGKCATVVLICN